MASRAASWKAAEAEAHEAIAEALETAALALADVREAVQPLLRPRIQQTLDEIMAEMHVHERAAREARAAA